MSLTKYREGSLRELWTVSLPLMLCSLSAMAMLFVDRLLLAHFSTEAHNAAVNATTLGWSFLYGWIVLANIAEVFVAQYNGAKLEKKLGEPVWQMIWLSLFSILFFIPFGIWGGQWIYGSGPELVLERQYFELMMFFGPVFPVYSALCGFFIGQGKTKLITTLAIFANIANALLDMVLIFGIEGVIPSYGIKGAAIATSSCTVLESFALFLIFINLKNQKKYGTANWRFNPAAFWECLRIGFPGAVFVTVEVFGFAAFYAMMAMLGDKYITIVGICQSILILFYFFSEGINKGAATIAGNLIGGGKEQLVPKVLFAGLRLHLIFFLAMIAIFFVGTETIIHQFLPHASPEFISEIYSSFVTCLLLIVVYMFFEGVRFLIAGVLTAAGDTLFLLVAGSLSVWLLMVLPVYLIVVNHHGSVELANAICVFYSAFACILYVFRFYQGRWKEMAIIQRLEPLIVP